MSNFRGKVMSAVNKQKESDNSRWYKGDAPTTNEMLARIYKIREQDPESADTFLKRFRQEEQTPTSRYYNPYSSVTNASALDNLTKYGIDTSKGFEDVINNYSWLKDKASYSAVTGSITQGKTKEQKAAYWYNQLLEAEADTQAAEQETDSLKKEINYWANIRSDLNLSDDEVLEKIDWKKYVTLSALEQRKSSGEPALLNRALEYSQDNLYGMVWAARNGKSTGNAQADAVKYALGEGQKYKENPAIRSKLDPASKEYNPYAVGSTMQEQTAYFGVQKFDDSWLEKYKDLREDTNYQKAYSAEQYTKNIEQEINGYTDDTDSLFPTTVVGAKEYIATLEDGFMGQITDPEQAIATFKKNYGGLYALYESLKSGKLKDTSRAIDFDLAHLEDNIRKQAEKNYYFANAGTQIDAMEKAHIAAIEETLSAKGTTVNNETAPASTEKPKSIWEVISEGFNLVFGAEEETPVAEGGGGGGSAPQYRFSELLASANAIVAREEEETRALNDQMLQRKSQGDYQEKQAKWDAFVKEASVDYSASLESNKRFSELQASANAITNREEAEQQALNDQMLERDRDTATQEKRDAELKELQDKVAKYNAIDIKTPTGNEGEEDRVFKNIYLHEAGQGPSVGGAAAAAYLGAVGGDTPQISVMSKDEYWRYQYIYKNFGKDEAKTYFNALKETELNARLREKITEVGSEYAKEKPVMATFVAAVTNPATALASAKHFVEAVFGGKLDTDEGSFNANSFVNTMRSGVAQGMSPFFAWLYGASNSALDMIVSRTLVGKASLLPMAGEASEARLNELMENGATQEQAVVLMSVAGLLAAGSELLSVERWFKIKETGTAGFWNIAKELVKKSALPEIVEEGIEFAGNTASDYIVRQDNSETMQKFKDYLERSKGNEAVAWTATAMSTIWEGVKEAAAGGLVGLVSGGSAKFAQYTQNKSDARLTAKLTPVQAAAVVAQESQQYKGMTPEQMQEVAKSMAEGRIATEQAKAEQAAKENVVPVTKDAIPAEKPAPVVKNTETVTDSALEKPYAPEAVINEPASQKYAPSVEEAAPVGKPKPIYTLEDHKKIMEAYFGIQSENPLDYISVYNRSRYENPGEFKSYESRVNTKVTDMDYIGIQDGINREKQDIAENQSKVTQMEQEIARLEKEIASWTQGWRDTGSGKDYGEQVANKNALLENQIEQYRNRIEKLNTKIDSSTDKINVYEERIRPEKERINTELERERARDKSAEQEIADAIKKAEEAKANNPAIRKRLEDSGMLTQEYLDQQNAAAERYNESLKRDNTETVSDTAQENPVDTQDAEIRASFGIDNVAFDGLFAFVAGTTSSKTGNVKSVTLLANMFGSLKSGNAEKVASAYLTSNPSLLSAQTLKKIVALAKVANPDADFTSIDKLIDNTIISRTSAVVAKTPVNTGVQEIDTAALAITTAGPTALDYVMKRWQTSGMLLVSRLIDTADAKLQNIAVLLQGMDPASRTVKAAEAIATQMTPITAEQSKTIQEAFARDLQDVEFKRSLVTRLSAQAVEIRAAELLTDGQSDGIEAEQKTLDKATQSAADIKELADAANKAALFAYQKLAEAREKTNANPFDEQTINNELQMLKSESELRTKALELQRQLRDADNAMKKADAELKAKKDAAYSAVQAQAQQEVQQRIADELKVKEEAAAEQQALAQEQVKAEPPAPQAEQAQGEKTLEQINTEEIRELEKAEQDIEKKTLRFMGEFVQQIGYEGKDYKGIIERMPAAVKEAYDKLAKEWDNIAAKLDKARDAGQKLQEQELKVERQLLTPVSDESTKTFLDKASKKYGVTFAYDESMDVNEEARIQNKTITLNPNASLGAAVKGVVVHEITHLAEASKEYNKYMESALNLLFKGDQAAMDAAVQAKIQQYKGKQALTEDMAKREIAAQVARNIVFADEASLARFVEQDKGFVQKTLQFLKDAWDSLRSVFTDSQMADIIKARRNLEKALEGTTATSVEPSDTKFSLVTDEDTLAFLNNQPNVKVYRSMQVISDELYPTMSAKVKNEQGIKELVPSVPMEKWERSEERPELIIKGNKYELDKANGSSITAVYNPYFHTSKSPLNDQFSSAYKRENLVTVEGIIPQSELTSGYHAQYAKDPVGEMKWHSGPVSSMLTGDKTRSVILSRWFMPLRIVPDAEVASKIATILEGENIEIPYNVVTPSLASELKKAGVRVNAPSETTGSEIKFSLKNRVSGNALLNAQDLIEELKSVGAKIDNNGYVTVYHRTNQDNANSIVSTGKMTAKEDGVFFSTNKSGYNEGYGDTVVQLSVPVEKLELDDLFSNEAHVRIPIKNGRSIDVSSYSPATGADVKYSLKDIPEQKVTDPMMENLLRTIDEHGAESVDNPARIKAYRDLIKTLKSNGISTIDAYHVTDATPDQFSENGIKGSALDYVGKRSGNLREESVYLFLEKDEISRGYGGINGATNATNNVLHVEIPVDKIADLRWDANYNTTFDTRSAVRLVGNVPSSWIKGDYKYTTGADVKYSLSDPDDFDKRIKSQWDELLKKYGSIPMGETPKVDFPVPAKTAPNMETNKFVRTAGGQGALTGETVPLVMKAAIDQQLSHMRLSNRAIMDYADNEMKAGIDNAQSIWTASYASGDRIPTAREMALGMELLVELDKAGKSAEAKKMLIELADAGVRAGQSVQSFQILKMMTDGNEILLIEKQIEKLNRDLRKRTNGKAKRIEASKDSLDKLRNSKTDEEKKAAMDRIYKEIAAQMPVTWADRLTNLRYLAMLGNLRTHLRNIAGNATFVPAMMLKNKIAAVGEAMLSKKITEQGLDKTKMFKISGEYKKFAKEFGKTITDRLSGSKYNPTDMIRQYKRSFGTSIIGRAMQTLTNWNFKALEAEDMFFKHPYFAMAFAGYLQANNVNLNDPGAISSTIFERATQYAIDEAKKATYQSESRFAEWLQKGENVSKFAQIGIGSVMPFKKTPVNLFKRSIEFSPIGFVDAAIRGRKQLKNGKINLTEYIDKISAGLSGTAIFGLGVLLNSLGMLTIGFKDDDEKEFANVTGKQPYALEVNLFGYRTSFTIDWASPNSVALILGANVLQTVQGTDWADVDADNIPYDDIIGALMDATGPVFDLTVLDGVNNLLKSAGYGEVPIAAAAQRVAMNYLSQYIPTLSGQIERVIDPDRRIVYADKNNTIPDNLEYYTESIQNKLFGASMSNEPYVNQYGQKDNESLVGKMLGNQTLGRIFENMILPGYVSEIKTDDVTTMLQELYDTVEGDALKGKIVPKKASQSFDYNKETINLTAEQYTQYQTVIGQTQRDALETLFNSEAFLTFDDAHQAGMVDDVYNYAIALGKQAIVPDYKLPDWVASASRNGGDIVRELVKRQNTAILTEYRDTYRDKLYTALDTEDYDSATVCLKALYESKRTESPDKSQAQILSDIRSSLNSRYEPELVGLYAEGKTDEMRELAQKLSRLGIGYDGDTFEGWIAKYKKEQAQK